MANAPYTQQRSVQFQGPTTSEDYNRRIEENYNDITVLYNQNKLNLALVQNNYERFSKDQLGMVRVLNDLEQRVTALEAAKNTLYFTNVDQIDVNRFAITPFAILPVEQCQIDTAHGIITLPLIPTSSVSKLVFADNNGNPVVPSTLGTTIVGGGADNSRAVIDTSPPELAIARNVGSIWQRNVIVPAPIYSGALLTLYIKAPIGMFSTADSNAIILHAFPAFSTDILEIAYTTNVAPMMNDSDGYQPFPSNYASDINSIGFTPPGAWSGDVDVNAAPRAYYFDPLPITGLRIQLHQGGYYYDSGSYVYSYGASLIDLRYDKFLVSGQTIVRFDAPIGSFINVVDVVTPRIYNIPSNIIDSCFSYQVIYETNYNSGVYTTNPVANSQRVWVQTTLSQTPGGGTPALSGLSISYS